MRPRSLRALLLAAGSVGDLRGTGFRVVARRILQRSDAAAIRSDWEQVGTDLRSAAQRLGRASAR